MARDDLKRTDSFPAGIIGVGLGSVSREIPITEPPPLPPNAELKVIGKPTPRRNAAAKVRGATRFTVDVNLPGMLHARFLRAPLPHAMVQTIDASAAIAYPGVKAVFPIARPEDPVSATVRYVGAPIIALAAVSIAAAEAALQLVRVTYKPLPFVVDLDAARANPMRPWSMSARTLRQPVILRDFPLRPPCRCTATSVAPPSSSAAIRPRDLRMPT